MESSPDKKTETYEYMKAKEFLDKLPVLTKVFLHGLFVLGSSLKNKETPSKEDVRKLFDAPQNGFYPEKMEVDFLWFIQQKLTENDQYEYINLLRDLTEMVGKEWTDSWLDK